MPIVAESRIFWYGDNLDVMREHIPDASVDLVYLDPPFNSQRAYNRFLHETDGTLSEAQTRAFEDYWHWGPEAELAFDEVVHPKRGRHVTPATLSETMHALRRILRESNMLAYLAMMAVRLVEMRRALKQTGSLYLHCDPTASHYLKLLLDALFGPENFRSEVIWKRSGAHGSARKFGPIHDTLLFFTKSDDYTWNQVFQPLPQDTVDDWYNNFEPETGRRFNRESLLATGTRTGSSGKAWRGIDPTKKGRHWAIPGLARDLIGPVDTLDALDALDREGRIFWPKKVGGSPMFIRYLEESKGVPAQDLITDIERLNNVSAERVGYPTQKPVALLERLIMASSNPDDLVLDPFCGCGTAVVAAESLGRQWVGIDITHVAVSVLKTRLEERFPGLTYRVRGEPEDVASARKLADEKWEEFQAWIVDKVGGIPLNPTEEKKVAKKGKDHGIDGILLFRDDPKAERSKRMILSVKAGKTTTPEMIDALYGVMARESAPMGALLTAHKPTKGVYSEARAYGQFSSEIYAPDERFDKIQVITLDDIFSDGWRGLRFPGWNSTRASVPPPGTDEATLDLFDRQLKPKPPRKARKALPGQQELPAANARKK